MPAFTLEPLRRALTGAGWQVEMAPTGLTVDCGERLVARLISSAEALAQGGARPVIVGHSRGGQLALIAATRHPELVAGVVTVATPRHVGVPDNPTIAVMATMLRRSPLEGKIGSLGCGTGRCCERFRADLQRPPPRWTAIWSATDRVVPPREVLRHAAAVRVDRSHLGLIVASDAVREIKAAVGALSCSSRR